MIDMPPDVPVSLVVLTHDEEHNIADCLRSAEGFNDIHVLDSGSRDRTVEIATGMGAKVHHHAFDGFGQQRNWAIDNIVTDHEWQLHLDADERLTEEIIKEIASLIASDPPQGGFLVPSKLMFGGKWLRYAGQYPGYQVRLFHRQRLRFADHGHGQREVTTWPLGRLRQPYLHFAFSRGLEHWFAKHARYARSEAELTLGDGIQAEAINTIPAKLFSGNATARRRGLKKLAARLPCRYFLRLIYMLGPRMAILDGTAGIVYAHMLATYEAMIEINLKLLQHRLKP
jgi:glycosyltransferase involved in cell wall biosynthesis